MQISVQCLRGDFTVTIDAAAPFAQVMELVKSEHGVDFGDQCWFVQESTIPPPLELFEDDVSPNEDESEEIEFEPHEGEEMDDGEDPADRQYSLEKKREIVAYYRAGGGRTFKSVKTRYKLLHPTQLTRFIKQVDAGGTTYDKWQAIGSAVKRKFDDARTAMSPVHDHNLRQWALEEAAKVGLATRIGPTWIFAWKKRQGIVSRKVSKVWPTSKIRRAAEIELEAAIFRHDVLEKSAEYDHHMILNTDQSGFQYEYYTGRTLSYRGEHSTPIAIRSMNMTTHSYTIMPTLSASGRLQTPLYLCTQEVDGRMGPVVEATYFRAPNVVVTCSRSGKLEGGGIFATTSTTYWRPCLQATPCCLSIRGEAKRLARISTC